MPPDADDPGHGAPSGPVEGKAPAAENPPVENAPHTREDRHAIEAQLGEEQVAVRKGVEQEPEVAHATVVDFRFVGYRRLMVQLDNGQIWRQIDGDRTSVERGLRNEADGFDVEMWGTKLGGYRMRLLPLDRIIRVERVR